MITSCWGACLENRTCGLSEISKAGFLFCTWVDSVLALFVSQHPFLWSALFSACATLYTCLNSSVMPLRAAPRCVPKLGFAISAVIVFFYFFARYFFASSFFSLCSLFCIWKCIYMFACVCMGLLLSKTILASHFFSQLKILLNVSIIPLSRCQADVWVRDLMNGALYSLSHVINVQLHLQLSLCYK